MSSAFVCTIFSPSPPFHFVPVLHSYSVHENSVKAHLKFFFYHNLPPAESNKYYLFHFPVNPFISFLIQFYALFRNDHLLHSHHLVCIHGERKMVSGLLKGFFLHKKQHLKKNVQKKGKKGNTQLNPNFKYKYYAYITSNWSANAPFLLLSLCMHS